MQHNVDHKFQGFRGTDHRWANILSTILSLKSKRIGDVWTKRQALVSKGALCYWLGHSPLGIPTRHRETFWVRLQNLPPKFGLTFWKPAYHYFKQEAGSQKRHSPDELLKKTKAVSGWLTLSSKWGEIHIHSSPCPWGCHDGGEA